MAKTPIDRITEMLADEAPEKRIAAAIVIGELRAKTPASIEGLAKMVESDGPPLQRHALDALAKLGARKALPVIFPLLEARDESVRAAAIEAVASVGDAVVPMVQERLPEASPLARRGLDAVLSRLGGTEAFTALLRGLLTSDEEASRAVAVSLRAHVKDADAKTRRGYVGQIERFIKELDKKGAENGATTSAYCAAIKILGFLEDDRAMPTLLAFAKNAKIDPAVRKEALIALRFALQKGDSSQVLDALVDAAEASDRSLAQTALMTLSMLELPPKLGARVEKLAMHPDVERARIVIEQLGRSPGDEPARVLVKVLTAGDRRRAELAAAALETRDEVAPLLAKALAETTDKDRGWLIRNALRKHAKSLSPAQRKRLLEVALERLGEGREGFEAALDTAREADPKATVTGLRELADKLRKKQPERARNVLWLLARSEHSTPEDRYRLASLELARSKRDTRPAARKNDEALRLLDTLVRQGFDVMNALRKDRALELEELYYVGFHFAEEDHPIGEELLSEVASKGGRKKIGKMAKNKLALSQAEA